MGRSSRGVTGIKFSENGDEVIGFSVIQSEGHILSVCENGYGKRTPEDQYRVQTRAGKGIYTIKVSDSNGPVVGILQVLESDDIMIMTSAGKVMRFRVSDVGVVGRLTQGVKLMNVVGDEKIISIAKIARIEGVDDDEDDNEESLKLPPNDQKKKNSGKDYLKIFLIKWM